MGALANFIGKTITVVETKKQEFKNEINNGIEKAAKDMAKAPELKATELALKDDSRTLVSKIRNAYAEIDKKKEDIVAIEKDIAELQIRLEKTKTIEDDILKGRKPKSED